MITTAASLVSDDEVMIKTAASLISDDEVMITTAASLEMQDDFTMSCRFSLEIRTDSLDMKTVAQAIASQDPGGPAAERDGRAA
jgi:serine kinase of HPr protein (carbohydrate metabolism regulator)